MRSRHKKVHLHYDPLRLVKNNQRHEKVAGLFKEKGKGKLIFQRTSVEINNDMMPRWDILSSDIHQRAGR